MTSAILTKLANWYPEVLTEPQKILGPNAPKVLEFWRTIEDLSEDEQDKMEKLYLALDENMRDSAEDLAWNVADEVVGWEIRHNAWWAALNVTKLREVFGWATLELVGNVNNKVFYDLIMSHKKP